MKIWRRDGNRYKSIQVEDVPREIMVTFADRVGAHDIAGPFMIECCENKFDKSDVMFYLYYYDHDVGHYVNRQDVPVTPELMDMFRDMVKKEEEEE